jgi:PAS domain S-box-containing protein
MPLEKNNSKSSPDAVEALTRENEALKKEIVQLRSAESNASGDYKSESFFRTVFEKSRLGNKIIGPDLKILQVNQAMVKLLGFDTKEEIIGTRILDYTPADHHQDWKTLQRRLWEEEMPSFSLETPLVKKDGTLIWCQVTSVLFEDQEEIFGYTIIEDTTEQHDTRVRREEFIGVASHELKTPITSLKATLQLMNMQIRKEVVPDLIVKLARDAERYTGKLISLISDILNTTNMEQGHLNLNRDHVSLYKIMEGCCNHVRLTGNHTIIHKGDQSLVVYADRNKIDQVLVNLVNNAVKYAPGAKEIVLEIQREGDVAKVSVTDYGKGIPIENIPKLFDRYYQVEKTGDHHAGLGLGLYISAEIIRRHGGDIGVESTLGKGSTFWFTLPLSRDHAKE